MKTENTKNLVAKPAASVRKLIRSIMRGQLVKQVEPGRYEEMKPSNRGFSGHVLM